MLVLAGQGLVQLVSRAAQDISVLRALGGRRAQTAPRRSRTATAGGSGHSAGRDTRPGQTSA
jgi:hypothetical protein